MRLARVAVQEDTRHVLRGQRALPWRCRGTSHVARATCVPLSPCGPLLPKGSPAEGWVVGKTVGRELMSRLKSSPEHPSCLRPAHVTRHWQRVVTGGNPVPKPATPQPWHCLLGATGGLALPVPVCCALGGGRSITEGNFAEPFDSLIPVLARNDFIYLGMLNIAA